jgi:hypothetical protein
MGFNLLTWYKPHEWRIKLLQMALQIEIRSATERRGMEDRDIGASELRGCFFAGIY